MTSGADFDPRRRAFTVDELKPQPIIRKRKKVKPETDHGLDKTNGSTLIG